MENSVQQQQQELERLIIFIVEKLIAASAKPLCKLQKKLEIWLKFCLYAACAMEFDLNDLLKPYPEILYVYRTMEARSYFTKSSSPMTDFDEEIYCEGEAPYFFYEEPDIKFKK